MNGSWKGAAARLRGLLADNRPRVAAGVFNAQSAQIAEIAGFEVLVVAGYGVSATLLGQPDVGLATGSEVAQVASLVCDAVKVPVVADGDTGFGNAINVMRTTEQFIKAGVAGIFYEDQEAPKRCGHVAGKRVIPIKEAVGKYRAAVRVRDAIDKDCVLIARTDARGVAGGSLEDTIRRALAYREAGVDMVFPEGLLSAEEVAAFCAAVPGPVVYNRTGVSPNLSLDALGKLGHVALVINGNGAMRAAARALWDYLHGLKAEDAAWDEKLKPVLAAHPMGDFHAFVGFPAIRKLEEELLPPEDIEQKYAGSIGFKPDRGAWE